MKWSETQFAALCGFRNKTSLMAAITVVGMTVVGMIPMAQLIFTESL